MLADKLWFIAGFSGLLAGLYALCMSAVPRKGWMRAVETVCRGIILCMLCGLALRPFGVTLPVSPLSSLACGYLGLPGAALSAFLNAWP